MTAFTDDDVKRLKKDPAGAFSVMNPFHVKELNALLARLEAAEHLISEAWTVDSEILEIEARKAWIEWRKSKGEGSEAGR